MLWFIVEGVLWLAPESGSAVVYLGEGNAPQESTGPPTVQSS
jgi:hypothetical protein